MLTVRVGHGRHEQGGRRAWPRRQLPYRNGSTATASLDYINIESLAASLNGICILLNLLAVLAGYALGMSAGTGESPFTLLAATIAVVEATIIAAIATVAATSNNNRCSG